MYSWADLGALALARQFPVVQGRDAAAVAEVVRRTGPIQSQTARSPFVGLAARMPGVTHAAVSTAYDDLLVVRGSNLRGTVHTSTAEDHALLEVATRLGQRAFYQRTLRPAAVTLEQVWAGLEEFARDEWRTPAELSDHLRGWLAAHDPEGQPRLDHEGGRYFGFGHGGLLRRPLTGGWQGQGRPGYRTASALLGDRSTVLADPDAAMTELVRRHLVRHGPASRHDLAWWAGVGLRVVDAALDRLAGELTTDDGPDGRAYHDLAEPPPASDGPGTRLLPEFDALFCAYDPPARERFVDPVHYRRLWHQDNGQVDAPLLVDGRLTGSWRLVGSGTRRALEVTSYAGTRRPRRSELEEPVAALASAYAVTVTGLSLTRDQP